MRIKSSAKSTSLLTSEQIISLLDSISEEYLRATVETLSIPRNFWHEPYNNVFVAEWITTELKSLGYQTFYQGKHENIVALPNISRSEKFIIIAAHYDSVPETPGADDNASALAALLSIAKVLATHTPALPVGFIGFNKEEDGLVGSSDFVETYLPKNDLKISQVHVLEMIGFSTDKPNSQKVPLNLPLAVPDQGNFLALVANKDAKRIADNILKYAHTYLPDFTVLALKVYLGLEKILPDLARSDHYPFWRAKIPAILWTDTAEFRNPNYHKRSDTPASLNYQFLRQVTQLILVTTLLA